VQTDFGYMTYRERFARAEESDVRCPDESSASKMRDEIEKTIHGKNTLGGVIEIVALDVPVGLGSFAQWDKRLEAKLAMAVMSVQAIKGVEVGDAFENAKRPGTQAHDPMMLEGSIVHRSTGRWN
jgi:chorismate synthase